MPRKNNLRTAEGHHRLASANAAMMDENTAFSAIATISCGARERSTPVRVKSHVLQGGYRGETATPKAVGWLWFGGALYMLVAG